MKFVCWCSHQQKAARRVLCGFGGAGSRAHFNRAAGDLWNSRGRETTTLLLLLTRCKKSARRERCSCIVRDGETPPRVINYFPRSVCVFWCDKFEKAARQFPLLISSCSPSLYPSAYRKFHAHWMRRVIHTKNTHTPLCMPKNFLYRLWADLLILSENLPCGE